jgi:hypothetical protein
LDRVETVRFWVSFVCGSVHPTMVDPLELIFKNYLNTQPKFQQPLTNITFKFFSFNMWEWLLYSSVLEWIEFDLSKINKLRGVILLIPIVLVPWRKFPLCHTPIRLILAFRDQISILIMGWVTHNQVILELGSETRSYPSIIFVLLKFL